jgi:hypothetical protein
MIFPPFCRKEWTREKKKCPPFFLFFSDGSILFLLPVRYHSPFSFQGKENDANINITPDTDPTHRVKQKRNKKITKTKESCLLSGGALKLNA